MLIFILYEHFFSGFDIPFVSIEGFSHLIFGLLYALVFTVFHSLMYRHGKANKPLIFLDFLFFAAIQVVLKILVSNSSMSFVMGQDVFDILFMMFLFYLLIFRTKHWGVFK